MDREFEPVYSGELSTEFHAWQDADLVNKQPTIDKETAFSMECDVLREESKALGYQAGLAAAEQAIETIKQTLYSLIQLFQEPVKLLDDSLNREIIQAIYWICQDCIGIELSIKPDKIESIVLALKEELPSIRGDKSIAMHPADIDQLLYHFDETKLPGLKALLVADVALSRGDFYLKSESSEIDGRLKSRIRAILASQLEVSDVIGLQIEAETHE